MGVVVSLLFLIVRMTWALVVGAVEVACWALHLARQGFWKLADMAQARKSIKQDQLLCPQGHVIETEGGTYECGQCGFIYTGSIWQCANPECLAITPYCNCPVCGLSMRSPYRYGRD